MVAQGARGYRAGYLPDRRREVERSLRAGEAPCVVATSALELGIDVGGLDAVVIAGWPGSRAATWQRAGRAGRRGAPSAVVLVASSLHLDRFKPGPVTVVWFAFFALEALIFGGLVIRHGLRAPAQGMAA